MTQPGESATRRLARVALERHPEQVSGLIEQTTVSSGLEFLGRQSGPRAIEALSRLTPDRAARLLNEAPTDTAARWVAGLPTSRAATLLSRLDPEDMERVLNSLEPGTANEIRTLASYPEDTAGHLMDTRVTTFRPDATVRQVVRRLRTFRNRRVQDVFLVDTNGVLAGAVRLVDIVLAQPSASLSDLAQPPAAIVQAVASRAEVLQALETSGADSVPVVDFEGHLVGVLRQEELVATAREAAASSLAAMVGAGRDERALAPPTLAVRKRLPWLLVNLVTAFAAAAVVGLFESTIAQFTALAVLLPVVAGQSGNTGAQALAVTMRGLALREIGLRHWSRVALKETLAGAINGAAIALVTAGAVFVWSSSIGLTAVIGLSMILSMAIAALSGALVPVVLTAVGQDPAQSSSIVLTTVTDISGFLTFLGIASALARWI